MQTWYAQRAGQQYGPFDDPALVELVRQGQIGEDDWLTSDFGAHWQPARSVAGLFPHASPGVGPGGAPPAFVPIQQAMPAAPGYGAPVAAIPVQPLAPAAGGAPAPLMPPAGAGVPSYPAQTPAYAAPAPLPVTERRIVRYTAGDGFRWGVVLLMLVLVLIFWYGCEHRVPRRTATASFPVPSEVHVLPHA